MSILRIHIKIDKLKEMSQYSFSYNYDSLYDAFNTVNRKGKMQKRYLSPEYLAKAQEYREMRKNLNKILRKKKTERTEEETSEVDKLKQLMKDNAQQQKILLQEHLAKCLQGFYQAAFVSTLLQMRQKIRRSRFILLELQLKSFSQCKSFTEM